MKKGKIITLAILITLVGLTEVKAASLTNWVEGLPNLSRVQMYECQTNNNCYQKSVEMQGITTETLIRNFAINPNAMTLDAGGVSIQTNVNELKEGYLYLTNYYVCANKSLDNVNALIYNADYGEPGKANTTYNSTSISSLSNIPGNGDHTFTSCKQYSGLYVPNKANNWATLRLKNSSSSGGWYFSLLAVENKELGIYSDTIRQIVENANGNVEQAVDRVNDTLNQDHNYNTEPSKSTTEEENKIDDYETQEDNLREGLNLEIDNSEITINPNANTFIWQTIDKLRGISGKIVLLFTSVLSLGLIKIVLGR